MLKFKYSKTNKIKDFSFGFVFALLLFVSIAAYAQQNEILQQKWRAIWHGTDWIDSGETIRAKEVAENFEYLKKQTGSLKTELDTLNTQFNNLIVAGCFVWSSSRYQRWPIQGVNLEYRGSSAALYCYGGAHLTRKRLPITQHEHSCPPNTNRVILYGQPLLSTSCYGGGDGGAYGGSTRSCSTSVKGELYSFICVRLLNE